MRLVRMSLRFKFFILIIQYLCIIFHLIDLLSNFDRVLSTVAFLHQLTREVSLHNRANTLHMLTKHLPTVLISSSVH